MKYYNICLLFVLLGFICCLHNTHAQDAADGSSSLPAAKRIALRRPVGKAATKTTTTTTAAPSGGDDDADYIDDNAEHQYDDTENEDVASSTTTTTTEAPKKIGPVIRPFRSNDDFLNSLKRRQQDAKKQKTEKATTKPSKRAEEQINESEEDAPAPAPAPSKGFKSNASLSRRKQSKPNKPEPPTDDAAAEESEQQKEEAKPKRPIIGRLALRKRN